MADHLCTFPEVLIGKDDEDGVLRAGMAVLVPCETCGETPRDHLEFMDGHTDELSRALLATQPVRALYHWAPQARRKQIIRYGLRPGMRGTTSAGWKAPYVCFADSPSWAWALSGGMRWTPAGEWDLWQTWQERLTEPIVLADPEIPSGIYEVRTEHRVYKRDLWLVGTRTKG